MIHSSYEAELEVQDRVATVRQGVKGAGPQSRQSARERSWRWYRFHRLVQPKSAWWLPAAFALGVLVGIALGGG
jgi:hypothetical protein